MAMIVRAKLFATLRRYAPQASTGAHAGTPFDIDLPDGATIADLVERLELPAGEVKVAFVNGRARPDEWKLAAGDEVGIFPPVGGG
jgi:molybdopterin converting factor small subunit